MQNRGDIRKQAVPAEGDYLIQSQIAVLAFSLSCKRRLPLQEYSWCTSVPLQVSRTPLCPLSRKDGPQLCTISWRPIGNSVEASTTTLYTIGEVQRRWKVLVLRLNDQVSIESQAMMESRLSIPNRPNAPPSLSAQTLACRSSITAAGSQPPSSML